MTHQQVVEVEQRQDVVDLALAEGESAKQAARIAEMAATEAQGAGMPADFRKEWARLSREAACLSWAHALRAGELAPHSAIERAAKEHGGKAKGHARAAELSVEI